ncbi:MAG: hypothetical protein FJZ13_02555 [Candidatus Omnitrophica bacterium]|nr:hypothetical protein [Candidatus Omnitrophota bacterium]
MVCRGCKLPLHLLAAPGK